MRWEARTFVVGRCKAFVGRGEGRPKWRPELATVGPTVGRRRRRPRAAAQRLARATRVAVGGLDGADQPLLVGRAALVVVIAVGLALHHPLACGTTEKRRIIGRTGAALSPSLPL